MMKLPLNAGAANKNEMIAYFYRDLMQKMNTSGVYLTPTAFVTRFRDTFPMFAETNNDEGINYYLQQDAEEFMNTLLNSLAQTNPDLKGKITELFGVEFETTFKNMQIPEEATITSKESFLKLSCHIESTKSPVNYLEEGIKLVHKLSVNGSRNYKD